ncbi:MAG TPA: fructose-bisphosphatase class III, partial [Oscillospiraceae bacterium]|nr:fructose-bisphosphatase class III [Oscillospiraceae bacterium]
MIDGGISKAYHSQTGIGGYTFIFNSRYIALAEHKPYEISESEGCFKEQSPVIHIVELMKNRVLVSDTDEGAEMVERINELKLLLKAYRSGSIKEIQK